MKDNPAKPNDLLFDLEKQASRLHCILSNYERWYMATMSVRIPEKLAKQLAHVAREAERPKSFIVQKAIEAYLEDYADLQVALDRIRDPSDQVVSGNELRESLGL